MTDFERLIHVDRRVLWHPYTQMRDFEREPFLFVDRAEGVRLFDGEGRAYYDTISSWWCIVHGHGHPRIKAAVKAQMDRLEQVHFAGTTHRPAILLAERLVSLSPPGLTRVFFSDNGSTACEVAIKMSFQYWKQTGFSRRERFISVDRGYHGDTIGTMSLGGTAGFHGLFAPLFFPSFRIPSPYCYRCPAGINDPDSCGLDCLAPLESIFAEHEEEIAGVILEPLVQAAGGMIVYPVRYLERLAGIVKAHGVHLILDEVATGFGRTGTFFAADRARIRPDFLCLSKGLTGGFLPMGATLTTEEVFQAFYDDYEKGKTFFHGHTFTGNPLAATAALASLDVFDEERVMDGLVKKAKRLQEGKERFRSLSHIGDVRGIGMIAAFEIVRDPMTRESFDPGLRMGWRIYRNGLEKGLILRPLGDVTYLFLPLSATEGEIDDILDRTYQVLSGVGRMA